jgi:SAM-dependent methyltransferase
MDLMNDHSNWHDEDEFWEAFAPFMFDEERMKATPAEVDQLLDLLKLEKEARILDLGCGTGRHSLELARRGYQVTGVDRTASFLSFARDIAKREELDVEFDIADMRSFRSGEAYDCVLSLFTSFGYFEDQADNLAVLANVYQSLNQGGLFLLDMMGKEVLARIFVERNWDEQEGVFHLQERRVTKDWSWMENRWILIKEGRFIERKVSHWLYSAKEISQYLTECGFSNVEVYGGLGGRPYDQLAKRLVVVARK